MSTHQPPRRRGPGGHGPHGMMIAEKPKNFKKGWAKVLAFAKPHIPVLILSLVFAVAGVVLTLIGPKQLGKLTDVLSASLTGADINLKYVVKLCTVLAFLYGGGAILSYAQAFIMASVTQRLSYRMRAEISQKINRLPLKYFDATTYGDVLSRVTNDVDMIGQSLNNSIVQLASGVVLFLGSMVMMFVTDYIMAFTAIGASIIGFTVMMLIVSRSPKYFVRLQNSLGDMNGHIEEMYSGHVVVKAYNGENASKKVFSKYNRKLYDNAWRSQFMSGLMMPLMGFIGNLGYVAVCVVGAVLTMNGKIGFGVIVEFMIYVRLFTQPLSSIAQAMTSLQSTAAAGERVFEFLEEQELSDESAKTAQLPTARGDVQFENVSFGYNADRTIINDFSAHAKPGQKIAIVGPTGAGKTTLVNLLMRFYEVGAGQIRIDGVPTSALKRENVHDLFSMVLQDTWLFEGTVRENIVYSKQGVTDEEIVNACKAVGLHHFIKTLPQGYDTVLGDKTSLSQGQRQLLTIARAMVENAPMLILDEATSSVDTRTEVQIQEAMDRLTKGRTSFIIAHRLSTIKNADLILVMKNGDVVESGTHAELLARGGAYAELYNSQFDPVGE